MLKSKRAINYFVKSVCLVAFLVCLSGCSGGKSYPFVYLSSIEIKADKGANLNSVTPIDLVIAYDGPLFDEIAKLTAKDYFAKREQLVLDHPQKLQVVPWELDPEKVKSQKIKRKGFRPKGALLFANYVTAGNHRIRVGSQRHLIVRLKTQGMVLEPSR